MLKLTNSLCRYLKVTCESLNSKVHVRTFTQLDCRRKTCCEIVFINVTAPFHKQQFRQHKNSKKRLGIIIPSLSLNEKDNSKQMSERTPTTNHASYGGQFDISTDDFMEWEQKSSEEESTNDNNTKQSVSIPANFRIWETVGKRNDNSDSNSLKFKVVSYNVLAQFLLECHPYLYTGCSPNDLKWKVRANRLYDEIINLAPDILCLQEVQASHLSKFYTKFEEKGYRGIFKQKTGRRPDGCAIYFKKSLFKLEDQVTVEYYQPELPILNRDNIGIMVKLVPTKVPGTPIVVATTHLLYNPKRTDVRLAQMQVLLAEIDRFAYYSNGRESGHLPIILTGDFNSTPESAVIQLLDSGYVKATNYRDSSDWQRIGVTDNCQHLSVYLNRQQGQTTNFNNIKIYNSDYSPPVPEMEGSGGISSRVEFAKLFNGEFIGHSLKLRSVYNKYKSDGTYEASTFQDYWVTVDYIYFSCCSTLRLLERLRLPTATECEVLDRLPNEVYSSDHLALAALFELRPYKSAL